MSFDRIACIALFCCALLLVSCRAPTHNVERLSLMDALIPKPVSVKAASGSFSITAATQITVAPETEAAIAIGNYLGERLRPATGYALPVLVNAAAQPGQIALTTVGG